jgi:hypothetical protein
MSKAPEPEILKRKRSRPSDWWAVPPTTPQQQNEPPAKKRGGFSNANADGKGMKDAPAAGNRGKSAKEKEAAREGENGEEDELQAKPVRRGRSSGSREELLAGDESSSAAKKAEKRKERGAQEDSDDRWKRQRSVAAELGQPAEETVVEKPLAKGKGRLSGGRIEEPLGDTKSSKRMKSMRRGKSSNTEAEVAAATESASQRDIAKKSKGRPAAEKEIETEVDESDEDLIAPQDRRRTGTRVEVESPADELMDDNPRKEKKKKRRSGAEILEAESLALTTTEDYAKGRPQFPIHKAGTVVPSTDDHDRGRKRTRHSDANTQDNQVAASSPADHQENGQALTRRSDIESSEADIAKLSKKTNRSRHRDQRVETETAFLRLQRLGPKKVPKPGVEKRKKAGSGSTAVEQSQTSKNRTRSSIDGVVESLAPESSKAQKKVSKRQGQEQNPSRKRKDVESEYFVPFLIQLCSKYI